MCRICDIDNNLEYILIKLEKLEKKIKKLESITKGKNAK